MSGILQLMGPGLLTSSGQINNPLVNPSQRGASGLNAAEIPILVPLNGTIPLDRMSNVTNSAHPEAVMARVFVGNLNNLVFNKKDVDALFSRYGDIVGLSMHMGYAFIQYNTEIEARNAVTGEDGRSYADQQIGG